MTPEQIIKAGELLERVRKMEAENKILKSKLANGIRVTAVSHPSGFVGWMENAPTFDSTDRTNAVLILDEGEE